MFLYRIITRNGYVELQIVLEGKIIPQKPSYCVSYFSPIKKITKELLDHGLFSKSGNVSWHLPLYLRTRKMLNKKDNKW